MASQAWRNMNDDKQRKVFDDLKSDSRKAAGETLGLIAKMKATPRKGRATIPRGASNSGSSSAVPPLPVGFEPER